MQQHDQNRRNGRRLSALQSLPLEKDIERRVCDYAKSKGCYVRKFTSPNNRSVPDRLFVSPGGSVGFLELKRQGQKPTKAQLHEIALLQSVRANVSWCDNVADGKRFIDDLISKDFWA